MIVDILVESLERALANALLNKPRAVEDPYREPLEFPLGPGLDRDRPPRSPTPEVPRQAVFLKKCT